MCEDGDDSRSSDDLEEATSTSSNQLDPHTDTVPV